MRLGARRLAVPAALGTTACLTVLAALGAPLPASAATNTAPPHASRAAGTTAPGSTGPASTGASNTGATAIGGPLMASKGTVVHYPHGAPQVPSIPASSWVIANANTGQVLAAKDPHGKFGPASTMKILTAITLIPRLNPNAMVLASQRAADTEAMDAGLIAGRRYKVSDLFTALLTISANDAAVALTQATGSFSKGMALINAEAHHLQAYDVVAKQPNGLPAAGQVESAYDEALIARQALANPQFMKYDSTLSAPFEVKPHDWETLDNQNWLLTKYPGALGGKIGWTISSEATYVGLARRHGVTLIVTIMHCTALQEITSAVKLLNWGFATNGKVSPVGVLVKPLPAVTVAKHSRSAGARQAAATRAQLAAARQQSTSPGSTPVDYAVVGGILALTGLGIALLRRHRLLARHRGLDFRGRDLRIGRRTHGLSGSGTPGPDRPSARPIRTSWNPSLSLCSTRT
jgi:serine-type D-Ala-D-Ala carboxypeptidase (penicillin-binding protein 5/6)